MSEAGRTWLILGASSPVAHGFARAVAAAGGSLILAARDGDDLARNAADLRLRGAASVATARFDAADPATAAALAERVAAEVPAGRLDLFLAFGLMPDQQAMEADPALAAACIQATYTGAVDILLRLAPQLEAGRQGRLVVLGSVAGDRGRLKNHIYGSAKAGLHAFTGGLRSRLFRAGVTVTLVKPGFLDTAMTWGLPGIFLAAAPDDAGAALLRVARKGRETVYYPGFWALIMLILRTIPERIFKKLSI